MPVTYACIRIQYICLCNGEQGVELRTKESFAADAALQESWKRLPKTRGVQGWQKKYEPRKKTGVHGLPTVANFPGPGKPEAMLFDAMHSYAGMVKDLMQCITGRGLKGKKCNREQLYDQERKRFAGWDKQKYVTPATGCDPVAPFRLTKEAIARCAKELASIKLFPGLKPSIRGSFAIKTEDMVHGTPGMAEYLNMFTTGLIKILVRSMGKLQRITIGKIADGMRRLWRQRFTLAEGKAASNQLLEGLALMLIAFPLWMAFACVHYVAHLAVQWRKFGPMRGCNCFAIERKLGVMMTKVNNRQHPVVRVR